MSLRSETAPDRRWIALAVLVGQNIVFTDAICPGSLARADSTRRAQVRALNVVHAAVEVQRGLLPEMLRGRARDQSKPNSGGRMTTTAAAHRAKTGR